MLRKGPSHDRGPITTHAKGSRFEVALPAGGQVVSVVLADHVKIVDCHVRPVEGAATSPVEIFAGVRDRLRVLLGL